MVSVVGGMVSGAASPGGIVAGISVGAGVDRVVIRVGADSSNQKFENTESTTKIAATTTVIQVKTSPVFAPNAVLPPAPPKAPANPPPRPR